MTSITGLYKPLLPDDVAENVRKSRANAAARHRAFVLRIEPHSRLAASRFNRISHGENQC